MNFEDLNESNLNRVLSGCRALEGCKQKFKCQRYQNFLESTPYSGWNAYQLCITTALVYFVPVKEKFDENVN